MKTFKEKVFSGEAALRIAIPAVTSTAALGIATANYVTNKRRHEKDTSYQARQLDAMTKLTDAINKSTATKGAAALPVQQNQKISLKKKKPMSKTGVQKSYSIDDGHFIKRDIIQKSKDVIDYLVNFANCSCFRAGGTLTQIQRGDLNIEDLRLNPKDYDILGISVPGAFILHLKGPLSSGNFRRIDSILNKFCIDNVNSNYIATKLNESPGSYIVELKSSSLDDEERLRADFEKDDLACEFLKSSKLKNFSLIEDTLAGAGLGATGGMLAAAIKGLSGGRGGAPNNIAKRAKVVGWGTLIGASLGLLFAMTKKAEGALSRRSSGSDRMMNDIVEQLKKGGFKEGTHFTRDPKIADRLKTKVAVSITRYSGDMRIVINVFSDPKLNKLTENIVKSIPNTAASTQNAKNKFNEFIITTISDGSADAGLIASISERFIRGGYPVYLVEVG